MSLACVYVAVYACRCDSGGDCQCLCTAVAAFASECDRHGVYVKWRNQHFCRTSHTLASRDRLCYKKQYKYTLNCLISFDIYSFLERQLKLSL